MTLLDTTSLFFFRDEISIIPSVLQKLLIANDMYFGKKEDEQEAILSWRTELMLKIKNFTEIDTNKSPSEIAEDILSSLGK